MRDVAYTLDKGGSTRSTVIGGAAAVAAPPTVRLFTVRGREVASISDMFRDDDVFIGVSVGRGELSVAEVRRIFAELYPNGDQCEMLVRKWTRRRRNARPRHHHAAAAVRQPAATRSEVIRRPDEPTATAPPDPQPLVKAVPEEENTAAVENETSESKPAVEDDEGAVDESRIDDSEPKSRAVRHGRRGESEPRRRHDKATVPLVSSSGHQTEDKDVDNVDLPRSRPRQRGRRHIRLPPLQDASGVADAEPPGHRPPRKVRQERRRDVSEPSPRVPAFSPVTETVPRLDDKKDLNLGPTTSNDNVDLSSSRKQASERENVHRTVDNDDADKQLSPAVKTDENYNIITDVPGSSCLNGVAKSKDKTETAFNNTSSRSDKDKRRSRSDRIRRSKNSTRSGADERGLALWETTSNMVVNFRSGNHARLSRSERRIKGKNSTLSEACGMNNVGSGSEKDKRRSRSEDVRMKTKLERQVSTVDRVTELYEEGKLLGDGNFAVVKQCRHRDTGREYAMKVIDKSKLAKKEDMIENEIAIMKQCNHVNIVRLYEEYETRKEIYLILELVKVCVPPARLFIFRVVFARRG